VQLTCRNCKHFNNGCSLNHNKGIGNPVGEEDTCIDWEQSIKDNSDVKKYYDEIKNVLKNYIDMREDYYDLIATWIIGTYIYEQFNTYPYLFINAMRGSGKTRLLKLVKSMACNGELVTSLREAVLFRTARGKTLCIDEFESIHKKENTGLRELLNACYKKGIKVQRMRKVKKPEGEQQVVEDFEPYTPICMANIWGMEEVLGDRCITMILEKSRTNRVNRLIENFEDLVTINAIKQGLPAVLVSLCRYFDVKGICEKWNTYINYTTTYTTYTTLTTLTTLDYSKEKALFDKIWDTNINGRNLELMFPLIIIAQSIGEDVVEKMLRICSELTKEKKEEEMVESKDVSLIEFISKLSSPDDYYSVKHLLYDFRTSLGDEEDDDRWLNDKWFGRALKRLNLIVDKRRLANGREVRLNIPKAKEITLHFQVKK
jgi:hypothetical protein